MSEVRAVILLLIASVGLASLARAAPEDVPPEVSIPDASTIAPPSRVERIAPDQIPEALADWVPWVMSQHPDLACPVVPDGRACVWPGVLGVDAAADGGRFVLGVRTDRTAAVVLPGGIGIWPTSVRLDGRAVPVLDVRGRPVVRVPEGDHRVTADLPWDQRPASLPLPAGVGLVELLVDGEPIPWPRIDSDGLRLGAAAVEDRAGEHLGIEVSRRIRDGVPLVVETVVGLQASGRGREVDLGDVRVVGTRAVSLSANLPARFTPEGTLLVQVRPGTYEVRFEAIHDGPVDQLSRPPSSGPWPEAETWTVQTDERVRAVNLSGVVGVDPARTTLPEDWRHLPAFSVTTDTPLKFETLRRGEPHPSPNQLALQRELWVDLDGRGLTLRDTFTGAMHQGWRLNVLPPSALGHAAAPDGDLVITETTVGDVGVEMRSEVVSLVAESRIDGRPTQLPAVGWDADVTSLSAILHLPPGYRLFAGTGIDNLDGSVLDQWSLFDLFFVLVLAMATGRLFGWGWGGVALAGLVLSRHEANAPQWLWALALTVVALRRVVPEGRGTQLATWGRRAGLALLALVLLPFGVEQVQDGLFPALRYRHLDGEGGSAVVQDISYIGSAGYVSSGLRSEPSPQSSASGKKFLSSQVDPKAVAQTGPGVPTWAWDTQPLSWSGPVARDHRMRLFLLGPRTNLLLAGIRVILLLALALRLGGIRIPGRRLARGIPILLGVALAAPGVGWASPDPDLLQQLEARLTLPPPCGSACVTVPAATLSVEGDTLVFVAEVHAGVDASWPVPGPTRVWVPAEVDVDGRPAAALARLADGFLHVRLDAGVHRVEVRGPLPASDAVALAFGLAPRRLAWSADGWALDGLRADGTVEASVQLARMLGETTTAQSTENLAPWLEVHRELDLGLPWRVRTVVRRVGPTDYPVAIKVPLLAGEAVTEGGFEASDGLVAVTLDRDQQETSWLSTLAVADEVVLTAPTEVPWTEVWTLSCSPMFACAADGPAPLTHTELGVWSPRWRVWPSERVAIRVVRPGGVAGQTTTIDSARLVARPGRRQFLGELQLQIRSSQGGRQVVTLPEGAELQTVTLDGQPRPLQLRDGWELHVPLQPGRQQVEIVWQQRHAPSLVQTVPAVDLGGPAANVQVVVEPGLQRWIALLFGPRWGPVPLLWTYVLAVVVLAPLLARARHSPLAGWQWLLLGLGMTQVPWIAGLIVVAWLFALSWRKSEPLANRRMFNLVQGGLLLLGVMALASLYLAIHSGLLLQPDMQVAGGGSSDRRLLWFVDRIAGPMPQPTVVSLPMWTWRVVMLVWALWLAGSLVRWLPWAFGAWTEGGWYRAVLPESPE